ncbi:chromate efflux transporter [Peptoniphilus sp. KCTC 25270]|uniref:chromate efflux transporter n=1 Tax=Peptoniphilus sp. KCTC 25270 TaxID=2897414 RepID=UPI001E52556C|nr:chromate efflux transporter [Peptoniphilus sp. KCTC 25270]MCD1147463.1 chromate efflux transporter [Peptoniphilus sp. KCTC 25270]
MNRTEEVFAFKENRKKYSTFLKDVFICSLGAYGGPEAHYGVFSDQMVAKKKYITEEELTELIALTGILPGPSSTQTIIAMGYKVGGVPLAFFTMIVWALPVLCLMTTLSFMGVWGERLNFSPENFRYVGPMAVGFILMAIYTIGKKVIRNSFHWALFFFGAIVTYFYKANWVFPAVLLFGGVAAVLSSKENNLFQRVEIRPPWKYFVAFLTFALGLAFLGKITDNRLIQLLDGFYRYGYLVIGGGQVVVPLMFSDLVEVHSYMTGEEFLRGFGIVQGLPGPMFSFSAYAGGMAARDLGTFGQLLGAMAGGLGVFLPGVLLIFFVYPIWEDLKKMRAIQLSISGIAPVACGLILASAISMIGKNGMAWDILLVTIGTTALLFTKKIPSPVIVLMVILLGVFT